MTPADRGVGPSPPNRANRVDRADRANPARIVSAAAVLVLVLGASAAMAADPAGELQIGVSRLPATLDPAGAATEVGSSAPAKLVYRQLFEGLVEIGERGDIEPGLASQWSVSRDGLTWTFRLRSDVTFHNGATLTPDIVIASLLRHVGPQVPIGPDDPPWLRLLRGPTPLVRDVRRGEPGTVRIVLSQPFSPLLAALAHPALAIVVTQSDAEVPFSGTGPYRVAGRSGGRLALEAARTYRGRPPRTGRLVLVEAADDAGALAELGPAGGLDVVITNAPPGSGELGLQTFTAPTWQVGLLALRADEGLFARKAARQAVAAALDPALIAPALGRAARPHAGYLPPGAWGAREGPRAPFDPLRARKLLAETQGGGASATLLMREGEDPLDLPRLADAIRVSLVGAGLNVAVRLEPPEPYLRALRQPETDLALVETRLEVDDPHFAFRPLVASDAAVSGTATNVAFYRHPVVDGLLQRGSQFAFRPERLRLYQRLQAHLAEELPYVPLYVRLQWAVARAAVRDLRLDPDGRSRLDRVWRPVEPPVPMPEPAPPVAPPSLPAPAREAVPAPEASR